MDGEGEIGILHRRRLVNIHGDHCQSGKPLATAIIEGHERDSVISPAGMGCIHTISPKEGPLPILALGCLRRQTVDEAVVSMTPILS